MRFLLDTSIVSAPIAATPNPAVVAKLQLHGHEACIAAPVWNELLFGCARLPAGRRRDLLHSYLRDVVEVAFPILPYEAAAAVWHASERSRLERLGRTAPFVDGQIAAIAHTAGLTLVTVNVRDFKPFAELEVVDWSRRSSRRNS
ncbi:MAG: type II toxin-antitoxin system VapC family toxin [Myxococcales bacterium]|nr:type II toxin-antitoxin system VapC family toxin [Myxococcales bacterium]MCB9646340.1 type II toxin-antitoxin system VapC family toxin [Deltaproteobacteria bacterium]